MAYRYPQPQTEVCVTSPMTSRTACQNIQPIFIRHLNTIGLHQIQTLPNLFLSRILLLPFHIKDFLFRSHEIFRRAMTLETPLHLQGCRLRNHRHLIDAAVASRTAHAFIHMNRMIEIREVRKVMNANPLQRLARLETRAHRFQVRTVGPNLFVAVHANGGRRQAPRRRSFKPRVAIGTNDALVPYGGLITEFNWVLPLGALGSV